MQICNTTAAIVQRVVETCELLLSDRSPNYDSVNDRRYGMGNSEAFIEGLMDRHEA
jgi:hypothetical protein